MPTEPYLTATPEQLRLTITPGFVYEPPTFHGTKQWIRLTPNKKSPRQ